MNVLIISSASVNIDENYINIAKRYRNFWLQENVI